jgi:hypothetical protein
MYFHQGLKNLNIHEMIYHHFFLKFKNEIFFLLVFGVIIVKMDNFHLFQEVLNFLFHAFEAMGNEIYKQHGFFLTYMCVLLLFAFCNGFGNNYDTTQEIYTFTNF